MSEELRPQPETAGTEATPKPASRGSHPYQTPILSNFGTLVELVQNSPGTGGDGGEPSADVTSG
ncbi:MAG TPA: hypothetical protein VJ302_27140 [Blastocatellia bacterium]|nr:hypothetical protein [Blastocatellia bacterium]